MGGASWGASTHQKQHHLLCKFVEARGGGLAGMVVDCTTVVIGI